MAQTRIMGVTLGIMFSLFMAAMEATVVATAMPTIVGQLGGLASYSWVFSAYMLASTTTIPLYGKISDLYGRKPVFLFAMALFLIGSALSGQAHSIHQLIGFRVLQGLGAGGLLPLAFIMIGEIFSFEQRARMQGLFSGVWGVASIIGPLLGGFLVDQLSWRWVFYINLVPGLISAALVWIFWCDAEEGKEGASKPVIDYAGVIFLTSSVVTLLYGLYQIQTPRGWVFLAVAGILFIALLGVERKAADPVLPIFLFRNRLFAIAVAHGVLAGWAMFGSTSFVPLFVQMVLETSATKAGSVLTPQMLGWVLASIVGSRLLLRLSYRTIILVGMSSLTLGAFLMSLVSINSTLPGIMVNAALMGIGMGLSVPPFMIAIQSSVERKELGTATSTLQFARLIGGAMGVNVMGMILSLKVASNLIAAGVGMTNVPLQDLMRPLHAGTAAVNMTLRVALAGAVESVFVGAFVAAAAGLLICAFTPYKRLERSSKNQAD
jgi:EmrB/QacA subfamily drug resistance transporter